MVALVGVAINILAAWILAKANRSSLSGEGAYQHILTDLYGFIGTVIASIVLLTTGYTRADSIASLVVVGLMLHAAWDCSATVDACFSRQPPRASTSTRSANTCWRTSTCTAFTTYATGRSPRTFRHCPRTS